MATNQHTNILTSAAREQLSEAERTLDEAELNRRSPRGKILESVCAISSAAHTLDLKADGLDECQVQGIAALIHGEAERVYASLSSLWEDELRPDSDAAEEIYGLSPVENRMIGAIRTLRKACETIPELKGPVARAVGLGEPISQAHDGEPAKPDHEPDIAVACDAIGEAQAIAQGIFCAASYDATDSRDAIATMSNILHAYLNDALQALGGDE